MAYTTVPTAHLKTKSSPDTNDRGSLLYPFSNFKFIFLDDQKNVSNIFSIKR